MLAIDTNVVVRYLVGDHPKQSAKARALIDREDVFVSTTVMLEAEWVLRSVYGFTSSDVCKALRSFAGLARVSLDDPALLAIAIDRTAQGMDFADALHLGRAEDCDAFVTFDRQLIKTARTAGCKLSARRSLPRIPSDKASIGASAFSKKSLHSATTEVSAWMATARPLGRKKARRANLSSP